MAHTFNSKLLRTNEKTKIIVFYTKKSPFCHYNIVFLQNKLPTAIIHKTN